MASVEVSRKSLALSYEGGTALFRASSAALLVERTGTAAMLELARADDGADVARVSGWGKTTGGTQVEVARVSVSNRSAASGAGEIAMQVRSGGALTTTVMLDEKASVVLGAGALATTATDGFVYMPTAPGEPTGVPTTHLGRAPVMVDSAANVMWFYSGGAWREVGATVDYTWNYSRDGHTVVDVSAASFDIYVGEDSWAVRRGSPGEHAPRLHEAAFAIVQGDVVVGSGALDYEAAHGYLYLPGIDGAPEGIADHYAGRHAVTWDHVSEALYVRSSGAWVRVAGGGTVDLSGYMPTSWTLTAGTGLSGGGDGTANRSVSIATAGVTSAMLRNSAAVSVLGRSANSSGVPADIAAGTDGHYLRQVSSALAFGPILDGHIPGTVARTSALSIAANQVAVGSGSGTLGGSADLTWASNVLDVRSGTSQVATSPGSGTFAHVYNGEANARWVIGRDAVAAAKAGALFGPGGGTTMAAGGAGVGLGGAALSLGCYVSNGAALLELLRLQRDTSTDGVTLSSEYGLRIKNRNAINLVNLYLEPGTDSASMRAIRLEARGGGSNIAGTPEIQIGPQNAAALSVADAAIAFWQCGPAGGSRVVGIQNRATAPTSNPSGGGVVWADVGAQMWREPNGIESMVTPRWATP